MDSNKKYDSIEVYLTGFGPFQTITENPTEEFVKAIMSNKKAFETGKCTVVSSEVFEAKTRYVDQCLPVLHQKIEESSCDKEKALSVLIHFGLYTEAKDFNIECQSTNFIKDEYRKCPIDPSKEQLLTTKANHQCLIEKLKGKSQKCSLSLDAGTYLCNYIYYLSLDHFNTCPNVIVLFIHIPLFSTMSLEEDSKCFKALLESLEEIYC